MKDFLYVFIGGGFGSIARWLITKAWSFSNWNFPLATISSNILSCLIFGFVSALLIEKVNTSHELKLLLLTGFCGGFSTYSAFIVETVEIAKSGQNFVAIGNIFLNFLFCVLALTVGIWLSKLIV